jgi:putative membrane protein
MLNKWQGIAAATASATLVAFTACGKGNRNNVDTTTAATSSGEVARSDSAATATAPGGAAATAAATTPGSSAESSSSMKITGGDSEILQVLAVVDQSEVQDGQLAQKKARHAQVKSYARELITDHSKSLQQDREIAKSAKIDLSGVMMSGSKTSATKTGSDTSRSAAATAAQPSGPTGATGVVAEVVNMHNQAMDRVRQVQGAAFDSAFVNAQIQGHQQVLSLLQSAQAEAQNPSLQQHVAAAIKGVQSHLDKGQQLQQALASGASGSPSDTTSKSKSDTGRRG